MLSLMVANLSPAYTTRLREVMMARIARLRSGSGVYHAMVRGVNKQPLFEEDADNYKFLEMLAVCKELGGFELFAYCLMGNHFHLLIRPSDQEPLETVFRRIGSRYAGWFNRKYGRSGHLFQDRFASEPVEDDAYFLSCLRYILCNPVTAGICMSPFDYRFSSALEYIGEVTGPTDTALALDMIGVDRFSAFVYEKSTDEHIDIKDYYSITDADARNLMERISGCLNASEFQRLDKAQRDAALAAMRLAGASIRQVSRVTGIGTGIVRRFPGR